MALETDFAGRVGSYAFKASLLLLASPKLPTLPLIHTYIVSKIHHYILERQGYSLKLGDIFFL